MKHILHSGSKQQAWRTHVCCIYSLLHNQPISTDLHVVYMISQFNSVKQQRFAVSVICAHSPSVRPSVQPCSACGSRTSFGQGAHLKHPHAVEAQKHTGGTGNIYWSFKRTRVSPIGAKAETLGSFPETELALNSKRVRLPGNTLGRCQ